MVSLPGPLLMANEVWQALQPVSAGKVPKAGAFVREAGGPVEKTLIGLPSKV